MPERQLQKIGKPSLVKDRLYSGCHYQRIRGIGKCHISCASTQARLAILLLAACFVAANPAATQAQTSSPAPGPGQPAATPTATDLAKAIQNPLGDLYYVPFQLDTNFNYGPNKRPQNILNVQPVIPIHINADWNIITRTILPLVWNPSLQPAQSVPFGSAPVTLSAFLSPSAPVNGWLWGVGPVAEVPLASSDTLGSNVWGGGASAVIVKLAGPWVAGALINNVWSFGGHNGPTGTAAGGTRYNVMTIEAGASYNFGNGWYLSSAPVITANWLERGDRAWTVPIGGGIGRVIMLRGVLPVSISVEAYWNALHPPYGSPWQLLTQVTIIF
ncbi:MAG TPA: hypothetical protein VHO91_12995 [Rhodopila sp.]|nr:hypothetical protein [Rhodopila sp.]